MNAPDFKLDQSDEDVIFKISAPCGNPSEAEIFIDKEEFTFNSSPYYLRLRLPGQLLDSDDGSGFYEEQSKSFIVRVKKAKQGEKFNLSSVECIMEPDLIDLSDKVKLIYLNETSKEECNTKCDNVKETETETETETSPTPAKQEPVPVCSRYGFANKYHSMFGNYYSEFAEMIDLPDPGVEMSRRRELREAHELKKWNDDHYLADTMETDHIVPFIRFAPSWTSATLQDTLDASDNDTLAQINSSNPDVGTVPVGTAEDVLERQLVDVLLAYCYDHRTTEGEYTVESGWTINKLSPTLSWFEEPPSLEDVVQSFYRRCLCYPLYRNFDLATTVHKDVVAILSSGAVGVTRCMLQTKRIFDDSEPRYLLNRLYIHDMAVFCQRLAGVRLSHLAQQLDQMEVRKEDLGLGIAELEIAAVLVLREEHTQGRAGDTAAVIDRLSNMTLHHSDSDTDSDSGTDTDSDTDSATDSSSSSYTDD